MIRRFEPHDIERILEIEVESFPKSAYGRFTFFSFSELYPDSFLVYEEDGIKAYIIFDQRNGHIISIAVDPLCRRKGIGRALAFEVIKKCNKAWVEVRTSNEIAQAFYRSLGFATLGIIPGYYEDEDALVMAQVLQNDLRLKQ
jgi:ribosomal protein S18 acetylase RimI-like enzyme